MRHLAENGISVNVASGFYHDHLFVQVGQEDKVMELLKNLSESANQSSDEDEEGEDLKAENQENVILYSDSE